MDTGTLDTLMRQHQSGVYRYLTYLGAEPEEAEDMVQETFIAAFKSKTFPEDGNPARESAWLRGTARNLLYTMFRKNKRLREAADEASLEKAEEIWDTEFLRGSDGFDYVEALRSCIDTLDEKQSKALELRYKQKESREEMARILEMSSDGVKSLLRRIRNALRNCVSAQIGLQKEVYE